MRIANTCVVVRQGGEGTVAILRWESNTVRDAQAIKNAIAEALAGWFKTKEGYEAWVNSDFDYNIGDLCNDLDDNLKALLVPYDVHGFDIDVYSSDEVSWSYDEALFDDEDELKEINAAAKARGDFCGDEDEEDGD